MPEIARVGDSISHGGSIVTGSTTTQVNNRPVAREGDTVQCDIHGTQVITGGSPNLVDENKNVARIGDPVSCGAVITSGSEDSIN